MPRLPECSTTHTRPRSSTHSSTKWLPEPSVPNCLAAFVAWSAASSVAGWCAASQRSALRADAVVALADAGRDRPLDAAEQRLERVGQLVLGDVELGGDHAAADVDADRGRDDRALGRDDRADGGADADVGVGHEGDVAPTIGSRAVFSAWRMVPGSMSLAQEMSLSLMVVGMSPPPSVVVGWMSCQRRTRTPIEPGNNRRSFRWTIWHWYRDGESNPGLRVENPASCPLGPSRHGLAGTTRTCDPRLRRAVLSSTELRRDGVDGRGRTCILRFRRPVPSPFGHVDKLLRRGARPGSRTQSRPG